MSTSPGCCSSRSGSREPGRAGPAAAPAAARRNRASARPGSTMSTWPPTRFTSGTGPRSATTCWWSPAGPGCCRRRPRACAAPGGCRDVFTFYTLPGAAALRTALDRFDGGRLVVNVVDMPIKCPVAPLEFCFLADWYFQQRGIRYRVQLSYAHAPGRRVHQAGLRHASCPGCWRPRHRAGDRVQYRDGPGRGRGVPAGLLRRPRGAVRPGRGGPAARRRGLRRPLRGPGRRIRLRPGGPADVAGQGPAQRLRHRRRDRSAGLQGRLGRPLRGRHPGRQHPCLPGGRSRSPPRSTATPTASSRPASARPCSSTSTTTPNRCTGHYPAGLGLPLLKESRLNHLGKLAFEQLYWHGLLPGRDIPGIGTEMPSSGQAP